MKIIRLAEPTVEPLTLADAKAHLRVDSNDEDALIGQLISAARARVEDYCNRFFASANFALVYDKMPSGEDALTLPPIGVSAITEIGYTDADGAVELFTAYTFNAERETVTPDAEWPDGSDLRIVVTAGPSAAPPAIVTAIKLFLGDFYWHREAGIVGASHAENPAALSLMQPYRVWMGI